MPSIEWRHLPNAMAWWLFKIFGKWFTHPMSFWYGWEHGRECRQRQNTRAHIPQSSSSSSSPPPPPDTNWAAQIAVSLAKAMGKSIDNDIIILCISVLLMPKTMITTQYTQIYIIDLNENRLGLFAV